MMTTTNATGLDSYVIAEDAPLGVQLWPTISPTYAPNYILESVAVIRDANGSHVLWTYQNGNTRRFKLGDRVTVS